MATNIGDNRMCVHINIDEENPTALVFELDSFYEQDDEKFCMFVKYKDFNDIGIDTRNIRINCCSKFLYLTRQTQMTSDRKYKYWLNLLVVEPFSTVP